MRVVIVAENASANFGGEAFLPLHYFRLLRSRQIETWLVVHARTRNELQTLLPDEINYMNFVPDTWIHRNLNFCGEYLPRRVAEATTGFLMHLYTQILQRKIVCRLVREHQIDIVHEPTPVSPKSPSLMFAVGAPVVMGPMNGGMDYPPAFQTRQSRWNALAVWAGRWMANIINCILPGKLKAHTLLVANQRTKQALPVGTKGAVFELVENGVDFSVWQSFPRVVKDYSDRVQFVYVGRLIDWKGLDLLLVAFQPVAVKTGATLEIIGDGKLRQALKIQIAELGLTDHVILSGWLSQSQCAEKLQQADVFVLASLLECGGAVVLEAMALGLPVITTQWGGPVDYVNSSCGILIQPSSPEDLIQGFTEAMLTLAESPEMRVQMGRAGQERVQQFDWKYKIDQILDIYQQTLIVGQM